LETAAQSDSDELGSLTGGIYSGAFQQADRQIDNGVLFDDNAFDTTMSEENNETFTGPAAHREDTRISFQEYLDGEPQEVLHVPAAGDVTSSQDKRYMHRPGKDAIQDEIFQAQTGRMTVEELRVDSEELALEEEYEDEADMNSVFDSPELVELQALEEEEVTVAAAPSKRSLPSPSTSTVMTAAERASNLKEAKRFEKEMRERLKKMNAPVVEEPIRLAVEDRTFEKVVDAVKDVKLETRTKNQIKLRCKDIKRDINDLVKKLRNECMKKDGEWDDDDAFNMMAAVNFHLTKVKHLPPLSTENDGDSEFMFTYYYQKGSQTTTARTC